MNLRLRALLRRLGVWLFPPQHDWPLMDTCGPATEGPFVVALLLALVAAVLGALGCLGVTLGDLP